MDTVALQDGAVTQAKLANNAVSSDHVEDGSLQPADIEGNIYNKKTSVYVNTTERSVAFATERVTVSCLGGRDLLINHVCNLPSDTSDLTVLSERLTSMNSDVNPASLTCTVQNRVPQSAEILTATVWCLNAD